MSTLLLTLALAAPAEGGWAFRDEASHSGRGMLHFRTVELAAQPPTPVHPDDRPPEGARFGLLKIGRGSDDALPLVWVPPGPGSDTGRLWVDVDRDGRFSPAERHELGRKLVEVRTAIRFAAPDGGSRSEQRTVLVRRAAAGDGLLWAVRGYTTGRLRLGDKEYAALLADGDADGRFDHAGADRVWIDLDGDGQFDGLSEQFLLGSPVVVAGKAYLLRPAPDGLGIQARERPAETGNVRLILGGKPKGSVTAFSAQLVSEWGELVAVTDYDRPLPVPVGKYDVDSLTFRIAEGGGQVWAYRFGRDRRFDLEVVAGKESTLALLEGLVFRVTVSPPGDGQVTVTPELKAASGMELLDCYLGDGPKPVFASGGPGAELRLVLPDGTAGDSARSGFA